jgi:PST family polysaccharide transporter
VFLLAEFGAGAAVLKMRELDQVQLKRLNGLAVATGLTAMILGLAAAGPLAQFFGRAELKGIVMVSSLGFVITSFQTVPTALLQRELRFRQLATIEFVGAVMLAILVLLGAVLGMGYWSLVVPSLVTGAVSTIWLRRLAPVPVAWPAFGYIREAARFSTWVFLGRVGGYLFASSDFLVVGRVLGDNALGSYQFAWTLANTPNDQVNGLVARVSGSFYSALQNNPAEIARLYRNLLESVATLSVPLVLGMGAVAPEFVSVVLGQKWETAVRPLQILCILNTARVIPILAAPVLQMLGEVRFQALTTMIGLAYLPALFYFGAKSVGVDGVAVAWLFGYPPILVLTAHRTARRLGLGMMDFASSMMPSIVCGTLMVGAVVLIRPLLANSTSELVRLLAMVAGGGITYVVLMYLIFQQRTMQMLATLKLLRS